MGLNSSSEILNLHQAPPLGELATWSGEMGQREKGLVTEAAWLFQTSVWHQNLQQYPGPGWQPASLGESGM